MTIPQGRDCWVAADKPIAAPEGCTVDSPHGLTGNWKAGIA